MAVRQTGSSPFLYGEARRICREQLEQAARESVVLRILLTPEDDPATIAGETMAAREYVGQMTPRQKAVLAHIYAGYELKEIARLVGRPTGTVASRLGQIRERARKLHDDAGLVLLVGLDRVRRSRLQLPAALSQASLSVVAATALFAAAGPGAGGSGATTPHVAVTLADVAAMRPVGLPGPSEAGATPRLQLAPSKLGAGHGLVAAPSSPPGPGRLLPLLDPQPEDTDITTAAPSPHYDRDHTVVALGVDRTCACPVLFRSTDGGATWQSTVTAAAGSQVMLPPDYPTDSRIFIGQVPGSATPDWVSAGWGQPFLPLAVPPGWLAMAGSRLLSASTTGVWSLDGGVLSPVMSYQGAATAVVASTGGVAYVLAPDHTVAVDGSVTSGPGLFACTAGGCRLAGGVPLPRVGLLSASGTTVLATGGGRMVLSEDGGQIFHDVTPTGPAAGEALAVATSGGTLWGVIQRQQPAVLRHAAGAWAAVTQGAIQSMVALSPARVLALLSTGGTLCTADEGRTWAPRCPADTG